MAGDIAQETQEKTPEDRRRYIRYNLTLPLSLSSGRGEPLDALSQLRDVSLGGFRFTTYSAFEPGENFRFSMEFSKNKKISGIARACWVSAVDGAACNLCGAQIISLGWGQRRTFRRSLEPPAPLFGADNLFDAILLLACGIVYLHIFQETGILNISMLNGQFESIFDIFRTGAVVVGALLLLGLLF